MAGFALPERLIAADACERAVIFCHSANQLDTALAWQLKAYFDENESSNPARAQTIAQILQDLAREVDNGEIAALAAWTTGMATQLAGDTEASLHFLSEAETQFLALGQPAHAASTLVSKLISLAMLGRYEEALRTGLRARAVFLAHGDLLATGKIEQNLGNIYFRRDDYRKAEQLYRTARKRFLALNDAKQLAQIDNCLASALTWQHQFDQALAYYEQALSRAEAAGLQITQAEIESNLGGLMLFQGRYDQALAYLEQARRRYASLGLEHDAAISDKELAEAYLEINLIPEALAIFQRLIPTFTTLGMRMELAWCLTSLARACIADQRFQEAAEALPQARLIHQQEGNMVGAAMTLLVEGQLWLATHAYPKAIAAAEQAEPAFAQVDAWEWLLNCHLVRAQAHTQLGDEQSAQILLQTTLDQAHRRRLPQIALRVLALLGASALAAGERTQAEQWLQKGLTTLEQLRSTLPSADFRIAYMADKASLYHGLVALAIEAGRNAEAFALVERSRSQTLLELVDGTLPVHLRARDEFEAALLAKLARCRSELNWFYRQLHQRPASDESPSAASLARLRQAADAREQEVLALIRQLEQRSEGGPGQVAGAHAFSLPDLQNALGRASALIEYFALNGRLLAFIVTDTQVQIVADLGVEEEVAALVRQFRFQIDTLRNGGAHLQKHAAQLRQRCNHYLRQLYGILMRPLEPFVEQRRLVIVPHRTLHYVPFSALLDGDQHLIERVEVCLTPSASVLHHALQQKRRPVQQALLVGVPDERTPYLLQEIDLLEPLFPHAQRLVEEAATVAAVRKLAPDADVLHLTCHGHFRPDNPMFSALKLADGWLTVRDAYGLNLHCSLVTLSACETGMNAIAPGDELIGLVRGFLAAGAPSLLVSLWPVDDATTVRLMRAFYQEMLTGKGTAASLRTAQCTLLAEAPHPFYWSPFTLFGRWD